MLGFAIVLLFINIFLMFFFFFKLSKKYADTNIIKSIRKDADRLVRDIAFQTEKSVTVIEDRIKEANQVSKNLEKIILLANKEIKKNQNQNAFLKSIKKMEIEQQNIVVEEPNKDFSYSSDPIKIYTKQIPANKQNRNPQNIFNEQIIEMAKKGFSIELIAEKVPIPVGEIELIISLNS